MSTLTYMFYFPSLDVKSSPSYELSLFAWPLRTGRLSSKTVIEVDRGLSPLSKPRNKNDDDKSSDGNVLPTVEGWPSGAKTDDDGDYLR